jgi:hypothetical protein
MKIGLLEDQTLHKNAKMGICGRQGDTYGVVGRLSNLVLVVHVIRRLYIYLINSG